MFGDEEETKPVYFKYPILNIFRFLLFMVANLDNKDYLKIRKLIGNYNKCEDKPVKQWLDQHKFSGKSIDTFKIISIVLATTIDKLSTRAFIDAIGINGYGNDIHQLKSGDKWLKLYGTKLKDVGVKINFNTSLDRLIIKNNNDMESQVRADHYILAMPLLPLYNIIENSNKLSNPIAVNLKWISLQGDKKKLNLKIC